MAHKLVSTSYAKETTGSVRLKPGLGIGNQNQDHVLVSVSEPKLLLPKPKLPPYSFPQFFFMLLCLILNIY